jgi:hypothetical protein
MPIVSVQIGPRSLSQLLANIRRCFKPSALSRELAITPKCEFIRGDSECLLHGSFQQGFVSLKHTQQLRRRCRIAEPDCGGPPTDKSD